MTAEKKRGFVPGTTYVMDYIFAICRRVEAEGSDKLGFEDIFQSVKEAGIEAQRRRAIEAGKLWRNYEKKRDNPTYMKEATEKVVHAMSRWGLLTPSEKPPSRNKMYEVSTRLTLIGIALKQNRFWEARRLLYDFIIRNDPDLIFSPSRFLVPIRDNIDFDPVSGSRVRGVATVDGRLTSLLSVGNLALKTMDAWGRFYGFTNSFEPKLMQGVLPLRSDSMATGRQIYVTRYISSMLELKLCLDRIASSDSPSSKEKLLREFPQDGYLESSIGILSSSEILNMEQDRIRTNATPSDLNSCIASFLTHSRERSWLIVEGKVRGILGESIQDLEGVDPSKAFVISPRIVEKQRFVECLVFHYNNLRNTTHNPFVWISALRTIVSKELLLTEDEFDERLTLVYHDNPESIELAKAAGDISIQRTGFYERVFNLYGQSFRMIRLERLID